MLQLKPLDENVPMFRQLGADVSPVVLVNMFCVAETDIPMLLKAGEDDANWMKLQPGSISTQPHQGTAGSTVFMSYAVWESSARFSAAFNHFDFNKALGHYPCSATASSHLLRCLAVPSLCVGA